MPKKGTKKATNGNGEGTNKSKAIRDYITANPTAKPKEIVAGLAAKGVTVSAAFVSTLRSNDKRKGDAAPAAKGRPPGRRAAASTGGLTGVEALHAAKACAAACGGIEQAQAALAALAGLLD